MTTAPLHRNVSSKELLSRFEYLGSASAFVDDIQELVEKSLSIFEGLNRQESTLLCDYMECYGAPSRSVLIRESDSGDFLIIILTGNVIISKKDSSGNETIVAKVGPGGFLGEMSLIDGQERFACCVTNEPTDFAVLTREELDEILIDHPRLGNKLLLILLQSMTERLRDAMRHMLPEMIGTSI